jgi:hypothetical protein
MSGFFEHSNEPSDSIKGGEFLDHLSGCQTLKSVSQSVCLSVCRHITDIRRSYGGKVVSFYGAHFSLIVLQPVVWVM